MLLNRIVDFFKELDFAKMPWGKNEITVVSCAGALVLIIVIIIIAVVSSKSKKKAPDDVKGDASKGKDLRPMEEDKPTASLDKKSGETGPASVIFDPDFDYETGRKKEHVEEEKVEELVVEETTVAEEESNEDILEETEVGVLVEDDQEDVLEETEVEEDVLEPVEDKEEGVSEETNVLHIEGFDDIEDDLEDVIEETVEEAQEELEVQETVEEEIEETQEEVQEEVVVEQLINEVTEPVKEEKKAPAPEKQAKKEESEEPKAKGRRYVGKYDIFAEGDSFRFRLRASNGEALAISELYSTEKGARNGIETVKKNIETGKFSVVCDKHDLWRFHLVSSKGRPLINSASYKTEERALTALQSFKRFASTDNITVVVAKEAQVEVDVETYDDGGEFESSLNGKYVIVEEEGKFHYLLKASNGVKICQSQGYASKASCLSSLENFRETVYDGTFYISRDKNSKFQFKLYTNKPKRVVMVGEVYDSRDAAVKVIKSIKRFAKDGKITLEKQSK